MTQITIIPDIPYAATPQRELFLDLRIPKGVKNPPLVMYIPNGGLVGCNRDWTTWWPTECGFAMASIETRVSTEAIAPSTAYDCKAAVRWLRANAGEYGYDGDRIGAWGHSAGGLLAALLGTSGDASQLEGDGPCLGVSSKVQAVVDQCGAPHDFSWFARANIKERFPGVVENLRRYLGGLVEDVPELARMVSPATYISATSAPILIIHGDADGIVPVEESIEFHRRLVAAGADATLRVLPGIDHGWPAELVRDDILAFLQRTLG